MCMKGKLSKLFRMKDPGETRTCNGLEISRSRSIYTFSVCLSRCATAILHGIHMYKCLLCATPMEQGSNILTDVGSVKIIDAICNAPYHWAVSYLIFLVFGSRSGLQLETGSYLSTMLIHVSHFGTQLTMFCDTCFHPRMLVYSIQGTKSDWFACI